MSDIEFSREHDYPLNEAHEKADQLFKNQDMVNSVSWNEEGTEADINGSGFSGSVTIEENVVHGTIELGMMAKPFQGKIEKKLNQKLDELLG